MRTPDLPLESQDHSSRPVGRLTLVLAILAVFSLVGAAVPILVGGDRIVSVVGGWATGLQVEVKGGARLLFADGLGVAADEVVLRLPVDRFLPVESPPLFRIARVEARIDPWALFRGTLRARRLMLSRPSLRLDRSADGQTNWSLAGKPSLDPAGRTAPPSRGGRWPGVEVGTLVVEGGTLRYTDARLARDITFDNISLDAGDGHAADGRVFRVRGAAKHHGEPVYLEAELRRLGDFDDGVRVPFSLTLDAAPGSLSARGTVANRPRPAVTADVDLDIDAPDSLATLWPLVPPDLVARTSARLQLDLKGGRLGVDLRTLALGGSDLAGKLSVDMDDRLPILDVELEAGVLRLKHLLAAGRLAGFLRQGAGVPGRFSMGGRARIKWSKLAFDGGALEAGRAGLSWREGDPNLAVEVAALPLYGGTVSGRVELTESEGKTALSLSTTGADIDAARLMASLMNGAGIAGRLHGNMDLLAVGATPQELLAAVSGGGRLSLTEGKVFGSALQNAIDKEKRTLALGRAVMDFRVEGGLLKSDELLMDFDVGHTAAAVTCDLGAGDVSLKFEPGPLFEGKGGPAVVSGPLWDVLLAH